MQNTAAYILVFLFTLTGLFLLTGVSLKTLIPKREKRISIVNELFSEKRKSTANKDDNFFKKHKSNVELAILASESKLTFLQYLQAAAVLSVLGFVLGLSFQNLLLGICMAACLPLAPYQYLKLRSAGFKKQLLIQMESAISVITNTYLQSNNLGSAIRVSLPSIEHPLNSIFTDLHTDLTYGLSPEAALIKIRGRIDSKTWREWIDRLKQCQNDHTMKSLLPPIIGDISDMREIQAELDTRMADIWREHSMISVFVLGSIPMMRFLNAEWYWYLTTTPLGKFIVALTFVVTFLSTFYVMKVNKPVSAEV